MEDVLDLYQEPYDATRPVVCMDEASKQLVEHTQDPLPPAPGRPQRIDYEYRRKGTASVFMFLEPLAGKRRASVRRRRTAVDWAEEVRRLLDEDYPDAECVRLVLDNLNTHNLGSLYEAFPAPEAQRLAKRLELHFTPKHASWLNVAEIELSVLSRQCLNRRIGTQQRLSAEVRAWEVRRNREACVVDWQFRTADARVKLKRLYPTFGAGGLGEDESAA